MCTPDDERAVDKTSHVYVRLLFDFILDKIAHRLGQRYNRRSTLRLIINKVAEPNEKRLALL